jgi:hypothetical protein
LAKVKATVGNGIGLGVPNFMALIAIITAVLMKKRTQLKLTIPRGISEAMVHLWFVCA